MTRHHGHMRTGDWLALQWQLFRPYGRQLYYTLLPDRRPEYFRTPWTYPAARPDSSRPTCIFLPVGDWHARIQRSQQLAAATVALGCQSIYVNPHLGLEYSRPYLLDSATCVTALAPRLFEMHIHLPREHELHCRALTAVESRRIASSIETLLESCGIREAALVVSFPAWLDPALQLRQRRGLPIVYDCHDWLPGFGRICPDILAAEQVLFGTADAVVFSSRFLQDRVRADYGTIGKSLIIRNAAECVFGPVRSRAPGPPTIGYLGALDHWLDVPAIATVAAAHPDWRIVLAGRVEDRRVLGLKNNPNVVFLGEVSRNEVPALLHSWDAAMIPFLINDLTLAANPIKLYEYLAVGLPVVSAPLPEVEDFGELVYLANSPAEFVKMAEIAVFDVSPDLRERRMAAVSGETWMARAGRLIECIKSIGWGGKSD